MWQLPDLCRLWCGRAPKRRILPHRIYQKNKKILIRAHVDRHANMLFSVYLETTQIAHELALCLAMNVCSLDGRKKNTGMLVTPRSKIYKMSRSCLSRGSSTLDRKPTAYTTINAWLYKPLLTTYSIIGERVVKSPFDMIADIIVKDMKKMDLSLPDTVLVKTRKLPFYSFTVFSKLVPEYCRFKL